MITRGHCTQFVGQHVVFGTRDGMHHGILHSVTADGILVRPVGGATTRLAAADRNQGDSVVRLGDADEGAIQEAWWPFFFFPFFALAFLWPWAWW